MGNRARRARVREQLSAFGLEDRGEHRPDQLSGGQRQRVAIARATIADPTVILADEPTGNLDSETAEGVLEILFDLNREHDIAFVLVTHNEELAKRCDRTVHVRDGQVIDGPVVRGQIVGKRAVGEKGIAERGTD